MHRGSGDNDGGPPYDEETGKVIPGVFSDDPEKVVPADYALPPGVPALMDEVGAVEMSEGDSSVTTRRRMLVGMGIGLGVSGLVGFGIGFWAKPGATNDDNHHRIGDHGATSLSHLSSEDALRLRGARALARGPLSELVKYHVSFLGMVAQFPSNTVLREGVENLMRFALISDGTEGRDLAELLLDILRHSQLPNELEELRIRLRAQLRGMRRSK